MRRIIIYKNELWEIAKIIKNKFPEKRIYLHKIEKRLIIKIPRDTDRFRLEELKTFLKTKYPDFELSFQYFV